MLKKISTLDAVFIALMAACGIALKPIVGPLAKLIGSALFIPSGSIAGAIYMIWPMLALLVVKRVGAATFVGLIQGIAVMVTGLYGSHGILTLLTYTVPGVFIDLGFLLIRSFRSHWLLFFPTALGNVSGALLVGFMIMHLPKIPLILSLIPSFLFGGVAGYLSWALYSGLMKAFPAFQKPETIQ
ncbi:MAG: ECF transporter S component [Candidatus Zhuqueibacterota bacterium]